MAELGAVASVVQLVDVALRTSGEICKFLDGYKNADRNAKSLRDALGEVEANVRSLRKYVMDFRKSKHAIEEYGNLDENIIGALKGFDADIRTAKQLLPPKPIAKRKEKFNWALRNNRKTEEVMQCISRRNLNLITALGILEKQDTLHMRDDSQKIFAKQNVLAAVTSTNLTAILQNIQEQRETQAQFRTDFKTMIDDIHVLKTSSDRQHEMLMSLTSQQGSRTNRKHKRIGEITPQKVQKAKQPHKNFQQKTNQIEKTIDDMGAQLKRIPATQLVASTIGFFPEADREEIKTTLALLVKQTLKQAETRKERETQYLTRHNDTIANDIGSDMQTRQVCGTENTNYTRFEYSGNFNSDRHDETPKPAQSGSNYLELDAIAPDGVEVHYTSGTSKRRWMRRCSLGALRVEITQTNHHINASPQSRTYISVQIDLLPIRKILKIPGFSIFYSTTPAIVPMVSIHPMIDSDHPVHSVIENGNTGMLQYMLATGKVHLRSRCPDGRTLLHLASVTRKLNICNFLSGQGLSWHEPQVGGYGYTPLHLFLAFSFWYCEDIECLEDTFRFFDTQVTDHYKGRIIDFMIEIPYRFGYFRNPLPRSKIDRELQKRWPNDWQSFMKGLFDSLALIHKPSEIKELIHLLQNGLNPNAGSQLDDCPLGLVINHIGSKKLATNGKPIKLEVKGAQLQMPRNFRRLKRYEDYLRWHEPIAFRCSMTMIMLLIVWGADIYFVEPGQFNSVCHWSELMTHCVQAKEKESFHEWRLALYWNEVDPDQVFLEDERQRKQAFRLRGATRSGIDEAVLAPPPIDGLRCRRCRRRYCNDHDLSIFKKSPEMTPFSPV